VPITKAMTNAGVGIDETIRLELKEHYENLRDNSNVLIQKAVPEALKPFAHKPHYKGLNEEVRDECKRRGLQRPKRPGKLKDPARNAERRRDYERTLLQYNDALSDVWRSLGYVHFTDASKEGFGTGWNKKADFNPNSSDQVLRYIRVTYGERAVPRHPKTRQPSAGSEALDRLARRKNDNLLSLVIDSGNATKLLGTFIKNWVRSAEDSRVHPQFTDNPATFRFSSKNPNGQNFPRRKKEAARMRQMLIPGNQPNDGWLLGEVDFSGIEAVHVGYYAEDPMYIWLAQQGVHTFFASAILADAGILSRPIDLGGSKSDIDLALKEVKSLAKETILPNCTKTVYDTAKPVVHGTNYMMGPGLMTAIDPDIFENRASAKRYQDMYLEHFPSIRKWHKVTLDRVHNEHYIENAFGYRRWFWDVMTWQYVDRIDDWKLVPSRQAKKVIATNPQSSLAANMRAVLRTPEVLDLVQRKLILLQIHDSLLFRAIKEEFDEVAHTLADVMTRPIPEQAGLVVPIEIEYGPNWSKDFMKPYRL
jgi:hypothetical protein